MEAERLVTFGELLKIKREAKGITLRDAEREMKITLLSKYERGHCKPTKRNLNKLMDFYKITHEELENLKVKTVEIKSSNRLEAIRQNLGAILQEVAHMPDTGMLAKNIKKEALEQLNMAHECIQNVLIIDRLL